MVAPNQQPHLAVDVPCVVVSESGEAPATLTEVSLVGMRLMTTERPPWSADERARLEVTPDGGRPGLEVGTRVMYVRERGGRHLSALQLIELDADAYRAVHAFVATLLEGGGGGRRQAPRVHHRHEVTVNSKSQIRAYLENISAGGLALSVDTAVSEGDEMTVLLRVGTLRPLELPGRVVRVEPRTNGFDVGLELGEVDPETGQLLDKLMRKLLDLSA